jgi:hypothetical protein
MIGVPHNVERGPITTPNNQTKMKASHKGLASLSYSFSPRNKKVATVARLTPRNHSSRKNRSP